MGVAPEVNSEFSRASSGTVSSVSYNFQVVMSIAIPTTAVMSILKKMLMSEHRMGLHEFSYQTTNFQCLSQKLYILNRLAEHLKSPDVCIAISCCVIFIDTQTVLFYTAQV